MRILYAEDYELEAELTKIILEENEFIVDIAVTGEEAWNAYNRQKPDILLLDLNMPLKTGIRSIHGAPYGPEHAAEPAGRTGRRCSICRPAGCWPAAAGKAGTQRGRALPAGGNGGAGRNRPRCGATFQSTR